MRCLWTALCLPYAKTLHKVLWFPRRSGGWRSRLGQAATRNWDYVVVGAGAAGCVVAGRLSQTMPDVRIAREASKPRGDIFTGCEPLHI
jgi:hypothetical protein